MGLPDLRRADLPARDVQQALHLIAHPEGGYYRELWREPRGEGGRAAASTIYFLLPAGERSHWHRIDAAEIWLWQAGAPLRLEIAAPGHAAAETRLGPNLGNGETLQAIVPPHGWQQAVSLGAWTLVACVVAPAFDFKTFELAPPGWSPPSI